MSREALVSVIVPFFNAEEFLQEAIESVFAQTSQTWELLLVDDGSTDRSLAIAQRCAQQYSGKVRYLEHVGHHNRGMSASRNLGIANVQGDYIAFLDADDVWLPHKLERQVAELESQPEAAMVYGPTQWWYSWSGRPEDLQRDYIHELGVQPNTLLRPPTLLVRFLRREGISPCTCSVLIRRKAVEQVGGFEEIFRGLYEDQAFFAKICLLAPVVVSHECLARYRQHPNSNCFVTQKTAQYDVARLAFLNWLADYLNKRGNQNLEVRKALGREMWAYRHPILQSIYQSSGRVLAGKIFRSARQLRIRWLCLPLIRQLRCLGFRRLQPVGNGRQRGTPIVRYFWGEFLRKYQADIHGIALEIGTTHMIRWLGGGAVSCADAIDLTAHSPEITVVADLSRADHVPSNRYDCFINQFTMHMIYDVDAALYHSIRILRPGGVLLINFSCLDYYFPEGLDMHTGAPLFMHWWFTPIQVENLLRRAGLSHSDYEVEVFGNLFSRMAYQMNLPAEELTRHELEYADRGHPLLICVRVVKPSLWQAPKPEYHDPWLPEVTPAQWNPQTGHYPP